MAGRRCPPRGGWSWPTGTASCTTRQAAAGRAGEGQVRRLSADAARRARRGVPHRRHRAAVRLGLHGGRPRGRDGPDHHAGDRRADPGDPRLRRPDGDARPVSTIPTARSAARCSRGCPGRCTSRSSRPWTGGRSCARPCTTWRSRSTARRATSTSTPSSTWPSSAAGRPGLAAAVYAASEGPQHRRPGGRGDRRPGRHQLDDPQLPRLPARHLRHAAGAAGPQPGDPVRHPLLHRLAGHRARGRAPTAPRTSCAPTAGRCRPARSWSPPASPTASCASSRSSGSSGMGVFYGAAMTAAREMEGLDVYVVGRRQLRRPGRRAPVPVRGVRDDPGAPARPHRDHVALPRRRDRLQPPHHRRRPAPRSSTAAATAGWSG